jgi:hypothetical protein
MAPTTPNQRTHGPRCSVSPALLACLACDLFISFGCIYFGKCRKECRCQRVADSTGETTATLGCVSKLRGSHHHHLLRYGNNAFLRDGLKANLFKTAHRAILLCLDFLAGSRARRRVWLLNSILSDVGAVLDHEEHRIAVSNDQRLWPRRGRDCTSSPHWRAWLMPESRCLVPANSFAEYAPEPNPETGTWRPLDGIQGRPWHQVEANSRAASRVRLPDDCAEHGGPADPSEGNAGDADDTGGMRRMDARAVGRGEGAAATVARRGAQNSSSWVRQGGRSVCGLIRRRVSHGGVDLPRVT